MRHLFSGPARTAFATILIVAAGIVGKADAQAGGESVAGELVVRIGAVSLSRGQEQLLVTPGRLRLLEGDRLVADDETDAVVLARSGLSVTVLRSGVPLTISAERTRTESQGGAMHYLEPCSGGILSMIVP